MLLTHVLCEGLPAILCCRASLIVVVYVRVTGGLPAVCSLTWELLMCLLLCGAMHSPMAARLQLLSIVRIASRCGTVRASDGLTQGAVTRPRGERRQPSTASSRSALFFVFSQFFCAVRAVRSRLHVDDRVLSCTRARV